MKLTLMLIALFLGVASMQAQSLTQRLRGRVVDSQSKAPLVGAVVTVAQSDPLLGAVTDENGHYTLSGIPVGRQEIRCTLVGYLPQTIPNIMFTTGKETVLDIESSEAIVTLHDVAVRGGTGQSPTGTVVSGRLFDAEETRRFAGSRNDPSRMAANYPGIVTASDARNDIIIRGNSPNGLLWRLEGVDIPNPNHFGSLSNTGGPVSMINNNVLGQSSFLTGAFPAPYGNALSGVFDLKFRTGNTDRREYVGQIGFNGFEGGAEGPFRVGGRASYLINYRYSTPALLQRFGFSFGTGSAIPYYQDLSMKLSMPTRNAGLFTLFGLAGSSHIRFLGTSQDSTNLYSDPYTNLFSQTRMGVLGASHTYFWNRVTFTKLIVALSGMGNDVHQDSLTTSQQALPQFRDHSWQTRLTAHLLLNRKLNTQNTVTAGFIINQLAVQLTDSTLAGGRFQTIRNFKGNTLLYQIYLNYQHRFGERLTLMTGLYSQALSLNNHRSLEPRASLRYHLADGSALTVGLGRHGQMQPLGVYVTRSLNEGQVTEVNRGLDFTYSNQAVISYQRWLLPHWQLKIESYFQEISRVPVERVASSYSLLNAGIGFIPTSRTELINAGAGRNKGLELTLEHAYHQGYYFLGTASVFDSRYHGSDGIWRSTAWANQYVANLLVGKEIRLGQRHLLTADLRVSRVGGKPFTPIDTVASRQQHTEVDDNARAYTYRTTPYFRTDFRLTFRRNTARVMQEWFIDCQNLFNTRNLYSTQYDARKNRLIGVFQLGFYPTFNWRIQF